MAELLPSTLEDHDAGGNVNAIVNGNWDKLNEIFSPDTDGGNARFKVAAMGLLKLDSAGLDDLVDGRPLRWNATLKQVEVGDSLASLDRLQLATHTKVELVGELVGPTAATMPAADHPRTVVYCSDGDGGNPCLAVSDGTDWNIIAFGSALTP